MARRSFRRRARPATRSPAPKTARRTGRRSALFAPESILTALTTGNMYRQAQELTDAEKTRRRGIPRRPASRHGAAAVDVGRCASAAPPMSDPGEGVELERLGRHGHQHAVRAGGQGRADGAARAAAEVEVGVRVSRRDRRACAAGRRRRPLVRRQRERRRLRARCEDRLHVLGVPCAVRHPHGGLGRAVQDRVRRDAYAIYFADGAANAYARRRRDRQADLGAQGRRSSRRGATGSPVLYERPRVRADGRHRRRRAGRPPDYECCTFRGSVTALDASTGAVVWKTFTHCGGAEEARHDERRRADVGAGRRWHLGGADDRRAARRALHRRPATATPIRRSRPPMR